MIKKSDIKDSVRLGVIIGILVPVVALLLFYLFASDGESLYNFFSKLNKGQIATKFFSLAVFLNLIPFLLFMRSDRYNTSKGILGITIFWAILVMIIKFI